MNLNVTVHIEELVLQGFAPGDRHAIAEGLQSELSRKIAADGVPGMLSQRAAIPRLGALSFEAAADASPEQTGAQIARSVWNGMRS